MYLCITPSTSTSAHIAFPPTIGGVSLSVGMDASNVDSVNDGPYLEGNRAIRKGVNNCVWSRVGLLIFVFCSYMEHDFVTSTILMRDAGGIFPFVVLQDKPLLLLSDDIPVCGVPDIENQVSAKDDLAWAFVEGCVICSPDGKGSST